MKEHGLPQIMVPVIPTEARQRRAQRRDLLSVPQCHAGLDPASSTGGFQTRPSDFFVFFLLSRPESETITPERTRKEFGMNLRNPSSGGSHRAQRGGWCSHSNPLILLALLALPVLAQCPSADLTGDCFIDLADFAIISSQWLTTQTDLNPLINQWLTGDRLPEDMVLIPAGTFQMGNSKDFTEGGEDELPVHTVTVDSFAMGKYEMTYGQYKDFLNSALAQGLVTVTIGIVYKAGSGTSYPYCDTSTSSSYSQIVVSNNTFSVRTKSGRDMTNDPMVCVSWYGAVAYCNWRSQQEGKQPCYNLSTWTCDFTKNGYRLPTEAEWEYAARGGLSGKRFPWGDTITHDQANYMSSNFYSYDISPTRGFHPTWNDGVMPYTSPVGSFLANGYGLFDLAGNVWEWCNDWYSETYYSSIPTDNPTGPTTGGSPVQRGGSWNLHSSFCRVSDRQGYYDPNSGNGGIGFRIVLGLK
jgi:sulfatase modifying factor 1